MLYIFNDETMTYLPRSAGHWQLNPLSLGRKGDSQGTTLRASDARIVPMPREPPSSSLRVTSGPLILRSP
jgi:hypothetical protein